MRAIPQLISAPLNPHTAISEEMFSVKSFIKLIAQTTKTSLTFHCHKVESTRNCKLCQLSGRFQTLIWRPGELMILIH